MKNLEIAALFHNIAELNKEFQQLIKYVTDESSHSRTAYEVDGKGVPMKREKDKEGVKSARLGKGEKRGKEKEAVVTAIYTIEPYKRTLEDVL